MESNLVYVALMGGRVGYFATEAEIPQVANCRLLDISYIMKANGTSKAETEVHESVIVAEM